MEFREIPGVIEAEQWFTVTYDREAGHGISPEDIPIYHLGVGYYRRPEEQFQGSNPCPHCEKLLHDHGWIDTPKGGRVVCPGDWIIKGVSGEYYSVKPDVFRATHEPVAGNMASTITATFEFKIGELVYFRSASHSMGIRPKRFCIIERIAQECHGGIQRFYRLSGDRQPPQQLVAEIELTDDEPEYRPVTQAALDELAAVKSAQMPRWTRTPSPPTDGSGE